MIKEDIIKTMTSQPELISSDISRLGLNIYIVTEFILEDSYSILIVRFLSDRGLASYLSYWPT